MGLTLNQVEERTKLSKASISEWDNGSREPSLSQLLQLGRVYHQSTSFFLEDVGWAESCRTAFRKYVTVTRLGPQPGDRKIKDHRATELRPDEFEYWNKRGEKSLGIGHVFKYPYAFNDLLARANDPELEKELDAKAWHLF